MIFETLKRLFLSGHLSAAGLENALSRGWITLEQFTALINDGDHIEQSD